MKKLVLFFSLIPLFTLAQTDSIFKKDGHTLVCKITKVDSEYIYFDHNNLRGRYISREYVSSYSINGKKETAVFVKKAAAQNSNAAWSLYDTIPVSKELNFMRMCLQKYNTEHSIGLIMLGSGLLVTTAGTASYLYATSFDDLDASRAVWLAGSTVMLAGVAVMIDSQKWAKKAGLGISGNGMGVYYRFK
jgi:hypothetical protein